MKPKKQRLSEHSYQNQILKLAQLNKKVPNFQEQNSHKTSIPKAIKPSKTKFKLNLNCFFFKLKFQNLNGI